jgi:hypothetical protein
MENKNGLLVDFRIGAATGTSEREVALEMIDQNLTSQRRITLAGDRGYDTPRLRACLSRSSRHAAHRPEYIPTASAIDRRTTNDERRTTNDDASWLRRQSENPQTRRGDLRVDEGHRRIS